MTIIKKLKQLFCIHEFKNFIAYRGEGGIIYSPMCVKCDNPSPDLEEFSFFTKKDDYNFSIVKGMAEYEKIYNKYYERWMRIFENHIFDDATVLSEMRSDDLLFQYNNKEFYIKKEAQEDAREYFYKKQKEKDKIERAYLNKINSCYLNLPHV